MTGDGKKKDKWNGNKNSKSSNERITDKLNEVIELLPKNGSPITMSELKEKIKSTGMSLSTLYKYFKKLEKHGLIAKEYIEDEGYPPPVAYRRISPFRDEEIEESCFRESFIPYLESARLINAYKSLKEEEPEENYSELLRNVEEEIKKSIKGELGRLVYYFFVCMKKAGERESGPMERKEYMEMLNRLYLDSFIHNFVDFARVIELFPDDEVPLKKELDEYLSEDSLERKESVRNRVWEKILGKNWKKVKESSFEEAQEKLMKSLSEDKRKELNETEEDMIKETVDNQKEKEELLKKLSDLPSQESEEERR